MTNNIKVMFTL